MSDSVIKVIVICFTVICCFGMMRKAMVEESKHTSEGGEKNEQQSTFKTKRL